MEEKWDDNEEGEEYEENGDNVTSDFIDIREVMERAEELPLSSYFLETRKNAKRRSAMSWLEVCDKDTVSLIREYGKKVREKDFEETKESVATANTTKDIFDSQFEDTNKTQIPSDEEDFYSLALLLLAWENDAVYINHKSVPEAAFTLGLYSAIDVLRRSGIVEAKGNGTLLSKKTEYVLTKRCKCMSKKELAEALKSINDLSKSKR